ADLLAVFAVDGSGGFADRAAGEFAEENSGRVVAPVLADAEMFCGVGGDFSDGVGVAGEPAHGGDGVAACAKKGGSALGFFDGPGILGIPGFHAVPVI